MDEQLTRHVRRWREAEAGGRQDEADEAFRDVFQSAARRPVVSAGFTLRTVEAIATAAERDRRRAHRMRKIGVPAAIVAGAVMLYFGAGLIASGASRAIVGGLNLLIGLIVGTATVLESGPDGWSIMASLGRAAAAVITDPTVTVTIFAIQGFAITALVLLRRLLGSDRESFR